MNRSETNLYGITFVDWYADALGHARRSNAPQHKRVLELTGEQLRLSWEAGDDPSDFEAILRENGLPC